MSRGRHGECAAEGCRTDWVFRCFVHIQGLPMRVVLCRAHAEEIDVFDD